MGQEASHPPVPPEDVLHPASAHVCVTIRWPHGARNASVCGAFNDWKQTPMVQSADEPGLWLKELELKPGVHQYKFIIDGQWKHDPAAPTVLDALGNINNYTTVKSDRGSTRGGPREKDSGKRSSTTSAGARTSTRTTTAAGDSSPSGLDTSSSGEGLKRADSDPYSVMSARAVNFSQIVPSREDLLVQHAASMMLPPHLLLNLPHLAGDGEKAPIHVQLDHIFVNGAAATTLQGNGAGSAHGAMAHGGSGTGGGGAGGGSAGGSGSDELLIYSMCTRYRDAYVTTVLYKPRYAADAGTPGLPRRGGNRLQASSERRDGGGARRSIRYLSAQIPKTTIKRDDKAARDYIAYDVEAVIVVRGAQMTLRSERRYTHFRLLDQMLRREFGSRGVYTAARLLPPKRTFGNLDTGFVAERRLGLERYLQACIECEHVSISVAFSQFIDSGGGMSEAGGGCEPSSSAAQLLARPESHALLERISTRQGYLLKQSSRRVSWRSRYFCLYDTELLYYYCEGVCDPFQPLNIVHVAGAAVRRIALASLPHYFAFSVTTTQHEWWMAAESEAAREGWVLALCNAGATLLVTPTELTDGGSVVGGSFSDAHEFASCSATQSKSQSAACLTTRAASAVSAVAAVKGSHSVSRLLVREGLSSGSWGAMPIGTGSSLSGLLISGRGIRSTLRKRPSKVHILHNLALEAPWVTRYFALLSAERMLVYVQHEPDAISEPQGLLPLSNYSAVEEVDVPDGQGFFAFQLCPRAGRSEPSPLPPATAAASSAQSIAGSVADGELTPELGATDHFVLLAETAAQRRDWIAQITPLLHR